MGCWTHLSHYLQSVFINPRCRPATVHAEATSIDAHPGEVTNAPKREAFLRRIIMRRTSISLPPRLVRVTSLFSPLRVTRESEEHDVSRLYFMIAR